jgi:hypothetical protein
MESKQRQPTKKMIETITWVNGFLANYEYHPTYQQIAEHFNISKTSAYMRLKRYRSEMRQRV